MTQEPTLGRGRYTFVEDWPRLPEGWSLIEVAGVASDSKGRVYLFNRGEHPVVIVDPAGDFLGSWGEGRFTRPHGIHIGPDDTVYCTDDLDHTVQAFTPDGQPRFTLGKSGQGSETGVQGNDYRTIRQAAGPFNLPTNLAIHPAGDFYVTDGYGNACVHRFSPDGRLLHSWGEPGSGPGQFNLPHGIAVDGTGRVYVADRENSRVQLFTSEGQFLEEWTDVLRPCQVFAAPEGLVYVAELGRRAGLFPGTEPPGPDTPGGRVSIFDSEGSLVARWGGGADPREPGQFLAPHDIWVDRNGDLYVGEVIVSATKNSPIARECPPVRRFLRT